MSENLGCLGFILKLFGKQSNELYPYRLRDDFLSCSEKSFYHVLKNAVGSNYTICPKVSLKEFVFTNCSDRKMQITYQNKIKLKHVDFLLCDPSTMKPVIAIELDDSSHNREDRIQRDYFIQKVFDVINLKLVRFENKKYYQTLDIVEKLIPKNYSEENNQQETISNSQNTPTCPKCGIPMIKRITHKGDRAGKAFYGCANFPKCREVKELNDP